MTSDEPHRLPALLDTKHKTLENIVVLALTSAMLGLVTDSLRAVAVDVTDERAVVHFAFGELRPEDREDAADIIGDLYALMSNESLPKDWEIEETFYVGNADESWPGVNCRRVFESKTGRLG